MLKLLLDQPVFFSILNSRFSIPELLQQPQPIPISAFLLCYFPLAAVVLGAIAFFALTDWHARRPYLRFNPFIAYSRSPQELEQRGPQSGETPAGPLGGAHGGPTVYQGSTGEVLSPEPPETRSPAVQRALESDDQFGELPAIQGDPDQAIERLNEPDQTARQNEDREPPAPPRDPNTPFTP